MLFLLTAFALESKCKITNNNPYDKKYFVMSQNRHDWTISKKVVFIGNNLLQLEHSIALFKDSARP